MIIYIDNKEFKEEAFSSEKELELAVCQLSEQIFGRNSVYLDIKKRIKNKKNSFINIPDAYVLTFEGEPKLWVIENELSSHDSLRHVGIQMLQFASQFTEGSFEIKTILAEAINNSVEIKDKITQLIKNDFSNLSEALDHLVYKNDYGFVVVIDEITDDLPRITGELARRPELLRFKKYVSGKEVSYVYDKLLQEVNESKTKKIKDIKDVDTMIAPAHADGHKEAFLEQKAWWAVRISPSMIPKLKYLAMYEVKPVSAIRWMGKIESIKPFEGEPSKYKIFLSDIFQVDPIKVGNPNLAPQGPKYTNYDILRKAKTLEDI